MIKKIEGWPYYIKDDGRVYGKGKSLASVWYRDLMPCAIMTDENGHSTKPLIKNLVWTAFVGKIPGGMHVVEIDGDPNNVRLTNLKLENKSKAFMNVCSDGPDMPPLQDADMQGILNLFVATIKQAARDSKSKNDMINMFADEYLRKGVPRMLGLNKYVADDVVERFVSRKKKEPLVMAKKKRPAYKERCDRCKYHMKLGHEKTHMSTVCGYILATGHMRNSDPEVCDKFDEGASVDDQF